MDEKDKGGKKEEKVDLWGKIITLVRETVLIILLLLLLLWPGSINGILVKAGFTEANIAGFTWQKTLEESNQETESALQTVEQLTEELSSVQNRLAALRNDVVRPEVKESVDSALAGVEALQDSASAVNRSLQRSYLKGQVLLEQIRNNPEARSLTPASGVRKSAEQP